MADTQSAWQQLEQHFAQMSKQTIADLFASDSQRFNSLSKQFDDLLIDFSKEKVTAETLRLLCDLARAAQLERWRDQLFSGDTVNFTEHRAVLHMALREGAGDVVMVDGADVMPGVREVRQRCDRSQSARLRQKPESVRGLRAHPA